MLPGSADLSRAAAGLAARLPAALEPLARLAYNYRWSWTPGGDELFAAVAPQRWDGCLQNPVRQLSEAPADALARAAADPELVQRATELADALPSANGSEIAYFCAEFGVHRSLPIYSGGLGALAGDIVKESSDRGLPLVGIGLLYGQGYFRQRIDAKGWQHEYWVPTDPERIPAAVVTGEDGRPTTVSVEIAGETVVAQIWRVDVGSVPLYLLDSDLPENSATERWITSRLYIGDPDARLRQYALLGIGGRRALAALGLEPELFHLNEGHASFLALEGVPREKVIFTTHTPVAAGNDTYPAEKVLATLGAAAGDEVIALGRTDPADTTEPFGITQFALRSSRAANGVSRRHGEVARAMWQPLWPDRAIADVPIGHVTNGVHLRTWLGGPMRELLDRQLGDGWLDRADDPATWAPVAEISDAELWSVRSRQRAEFVEWVRGRSVVDRFGRDEPRSYAQAAEKEFDPDALTIGFARRLATYKRLHLLGAEARRAADLLAGDRPVQLVLAGKAHPRDQDGKKMVADLFEFKDAPGIDGHVIYLEDYDHASAARMVRGCDVWLNLPRPPKEASGTSGMKSAANGGLQLSVLDGWWAEGYLGDNGWSLSGDVMTDEAAQDKRDSADLHRLLAEDVTGTFYDRDDAGIPVAWLALVRRSIMTNGPAFSASRMMRDYERDYYGRS